MMKLFLIKQDQNDGYDSHDSAVVAAPNDEVARQMNPSNGEQIVWGERYSSWCSDPKYVTVTYLGESADGIKRGVICSSFNAG